MALTQEEERAPLSDRPASERGGTMSIIAKPSALCGPSRLARWGLVMGMMLVSWGMGAAIPIMEAGAQAPGVWGGPGVAPPTAPAPPMTPYYYPGPYDPRAFYPPPYYPPQHFYPCPRVWVPGYYDAYGNWVFGYYHYECY